MMREEGGDMAVECVGFMTARLTIRSNEFEGIFNFKYFTHCSTAALLWPANIHVAMAVLWTSSRTLPSQPHIHYYQRAMLPNVRTMPLWKSIGGRTRHSTGTPKVKLQITDSYDLQWQKDVALLDCIGEELQFGEDLPNRIVLCWRYSNKWWCHRDLCHGWIW